MNAPRRAYPRTHQHMTYVCLMHIYSPRRAYPRTHHHMCYALCCGTHTMQADTRMHICMLMHIYSRTHPHAHVHTPAHTYTRTRTHTQITLLDHVPNRRAWKRESERHSTHCLLIYMHACIHKLHIFPPSSIWGRIKEQGSSISSKQQVCLHSQNLPCSSNCLDLDV